MRTKMGFLVVLCVIVLSASKSIAQAPDYVSIYEITGKHQKIELKKDFHIIDINSQILIEFDSVLMVQQQKNLKVMPAVVAKRNETILNLTERALSDIEIFPDPTDTKKRTSFVISAHDPYHRKILLDLRSRNAILNAKGKELQEYDHLIISFKEEPVPKEHSVEIELIETGLSIPTEIGAPLMVFKTGKKNSKVKLGLGVSGIFHVKTRSGLQHYFGFGLTISPNNIDLGEINNSRISIIPTISIGLGRKNPDIFLIGAGYQTVLDRPVYFAALNMAWIGRLMK